MKVQDVLKHYGSQSDCAAHFKIARQTVHSWVKTHRVPRAWQFEIEKDTRGKLKVAPLR